MPTPLPTIAGVYYGYVWMTYQGNKCGSVFTFKDEAPSLIPADDASKAQIIADALTSSWVTNMIPRYPVGVSGTDSRVYALGFPTLPPAFGHTTSTGSVGGDVAPVAAAAVIRHSVFRRGRGSQSHTAISPLMVGEITANGEEVTAAFITNVTSDFENFIAGVQAAYVAGWGAGGISYVQLSKAHATTYDITGSAVEALLGTERSRTSRP